MNLTLVRTLDFDDERAIVRLPASHELTGYPKTSGATYRIASIYRGFEEDSAFENGEIWLWLARQTKKGEDYKSGAGVWERRGENFTGWLVDAFEYASELAPVPNLSSSQSSPKKEDVFPEPQPVVQTVVQPVVQTEAPVQRKSAPKGPSVLSHLFRENSEALSAWNARRSESWQKVMLGDWENPKCAKAVAVSAVVAASATVAAAVSVAIAVIPS